LRNQPLIFLHLKLVAKISLGVGVVAVSSLLISLMFLTGQTQESYAQIVRNHSLTRAHLATVMLLIGLTLVAVAALITWMITLYSSFRIAGPLYRFSQNLKLASASDVAALRGLRRGDSLREQENNILRAVDALREHHAAVEQASDAAAAALKGNDAAAYVEAVARLKALDEKVGV
jgi:hypothetical protein